MIKLNCYVRTKIGVIGKVVDVVPKRTLRDREKYYILGVRGYRTKDSILDYNYSLGPLIYKDDLVVVDGVKYTVRQDTYLWGTTYIERPTNECTTRRTTIEHLLTCNKITQIQTKEQFDNNSTFINMLEREVL